MGRDHAEAAGDRLHVGAVLSGTSMRPFKDRLDAGRQLATRLDDYAHDADLIVLALPRGGVPVAFEVALLLGAPLDLLLVRKLGVPGHPELAMGAIAAGGIEVLSHDLIADLGLTSAQVQHVGSRERLELERRDRLFRGEHPLPILRDRTVILVDDGLATGATMEAAILAVRKQAPARLVVAVPVGARATCHRLRRLVDSLVCVSMPEPFDAVGQWYEQFAQTSDEDVRQYLAAAGDAKRSRDGGEARESPGLIRERARLRDTGCK